MRILKFIFAAIFLCSPAFFAASDVLRPQDVNQEAPDNVPVEVTYDSRGDHDSRRPLAISLTLSWNTFLGGISADMISGIAVDPLGNIYVAGESAMPWGSPIRAHSDRMDAFVAKLNANGNLLWNTFLGGTPTDWGRDIAVDQFGNVYVAGYSDGTWGSPVRAFSGDNDDVFVAKLNTYGMLQWNTFLGGTDKDVGYGLAVDTIGNIYVSGDSWASWGSPIRAFSGNDDAFVAKLDASGNLSWNTFLGGTDKDVGYGLAVDTIGNVYVTGNSWATWGSPIRPITGPEIAFIAKLNTRGVLQWNTFLGGGRGEGIAIDSIGNVYVTGYSIATWGSPVRSYSGGWDAFVAKLDSYGNLGWNTFLGGLGYEEGIGVVVNSIGNIYMTGIGEQTWGSPIRPPFGGADGLVAKLDAGGNLRWNTFLGGTGYDEGKDIAVDSVGNIYVAGDSGATWGTPIRAFAGLDDGFVAKIKERCSLTITSALHGTTNPAPGTYFYDANSTASVSAIADGGYVLDKWTGDVPAGQETSATISILMDAGKSIRANFKAGYSLTIASGPHGTTNPAPGTYSYNTGSTASVSAISDSGYVFDRWTGDVPAGQETSATVSILMDAGKSIRANFKVGYSLTIASGLHGTTNPAPGIYSYGAGSTASVSAISDGGYALDKWTGDVPAGQETSATVSILMNANKSIQASFRAVNPPSNLTAVRLTNRSVTQTEYIVDLTWESNPDNAGLSIAAYRVYRKEGDSWIKIADLSSDALSYRVRNVPEAEQTFGVTSVTDSGAESAKTPVVK
ncbi:MAG: SBBP repeat-containing protein [Candidatus Aminicenantes bacterium]|nr:SBBP repeat-containing protein [Candidatus Aminicenantes bacterium]